MGSGKLRHFIKDCWNKKGNKEANKKVKVIKESRNIRDCLIKALYFVIIIYIKFIKKLNIV